MEKEIKLFTDELVQQGEHLKQGEDIMSINDLIKKKEVTLEEIKPFLKELEKDLRKCTDDIFVGLNTIKLRELNMGSKMFKNPNYGFVYLIKNNKNGLTKIGKTKKLSNRIKSLNGSYKSASGENMDLSIEFLLFTHISILDDLELDLHSFFADNRKHGEWFDLKDEHYKEEWITEGNVIFVNDIPVNLCDGLDYHLYQDVDLQERFSAFEICAYHGLTLSDLNTEFGTFSLEQVNRSNLLKLAIDVCSVPIELYGKFSPNCFKERSFYGNNKYTEDIEKTHKFINTLK